MSLPYTNFHLNRLICTIPSTVANFSLGFPEPFRIYDGKLVTVMVMENNARTVVTGYILIIVDPISGYYNVYKTAGINAATDRSFQNTFGTLSYINGDIITVNPITTQSFSSFKIPTFIQANVIGYFVSNPTIKIIPDCPDAIGGGVAAYIVDPSKKVIYFEYSNNYCSILGIDGATKNTFLGPSAFNITMQYGNQGAGGGGTYVIGNRLLSFDGVSGNLYSFSSNSNWPSSTECTTQLNNLSISTVSSELFSCQVSDNFFPCEIDNNLFSFSYGLTSNWFIFTSIFYGIQIAYRSYENQSIPNACFIGGHVYTGVQGIGNTLEIMSDNISTPITIPEYTPNYTQIGYDFASTNPGKIATIKDHNYLINHSRPVSAIGKYKS